MSMKGVSAAGTTPSASFAFGSNRNGAVMLRTGDVGRVGRVEDTDVAVERRRCLESVAIVAIAGEQQEVCLIERQQFALRGDPRLAVNRLVERNGTMCSRTS